jgi:hypothetical protein
MEGIENWNEIRVHFSKSFATSLHVSIASVDVENNPTNTPVGSLFLNQNQTGFYFEKYVTKLPTNAQANKNICVLGVDSGKLFWLKSLFRVKFSKAPAIKLYGKLGDQKPATDVQIRALNKRMKATNQLKGHKYLWGDMTFVREINFNKVEKINLGKMTSHL